MLKDMDFFIDYINELPRDINNKINFMIAFA